MTFNLDKVGVGVVLLGNDDQLDAGDAVFTFIAKATAERCISRRNILYPFSRVGKINSFEKRTWWWLAYCIANHRNRSAPQIGSTESTFVALIMEYFFSFIKSVQNL